MEGRSEGVNELSGEVEEEEEGQKRKEMFYPTMFNFSPFLSPFFFFCLFSTSPSPTVSDCSPDSFHSAAALS